MGVRTLIYRHIQTYPDISRLDIRTSGYPTSGYPDTRTNPDKSRQIQTRFGSPSGERCTCFQRTRRTSQEQAKNKPTRTRANKTEQILSKDPPLPPPLLPFIGWAVVVRRLLVRLLLTQPHPLLLEDGGGVLLVVSIQHLELVVSERLDDGLQSNPSIHRPEGQ